MKKINEFLRKNDAALFLGVTGNTLINWEKQGKITVYRNPINNYRLYKKEDLEEILVDILIHKKIGGSLVKNKNE